MTPAGSSASLIARRQPRRALHANPVVVGDAGILLQRRLHHVSPQLVVGLHGRGVGAKAARRNHVQRRALVVDVGDVPHHDRHGLGRGSRDGRVELRQARPRGGELDGLRNAALDGDVVGEPGPVEAPLFPMHPGLGAQALPSKRPRRAVRNVRLDGRQLVVAVEGQDHHPAVAVAEAGVFGLGLDGVVDAQHRGAHSPGQEPARGLQRRLEGVEEEGGEDSAVRSRHQSKRDLGDDAKRPL